MYSQVVYKSKKISVVYLTILLLISVFLMGQEESGDDKSQGARTFFKLKNISPDSSNYRSHEGYISNRYTVNHLIFLFGSFSAFEPDTTIPGLRMIVKNAVDSVFYASPGFSDSEALSPLFFASDSAVTSLLVCVDAGGFGSWGNTVFRVSRQQVKKLGHISAATYDPNDLPGNIMAVSSVSAIDDTLMVEFPADTLLLNPGGEGEQKVVGTEIFYRYDGKQFELIRKSSCN